MFYEPNIEDGKVLLFHVKNKTIWKGNTDAYRIIKCLLDKFIDIKNIVNQVSKFYPDTPEELICESVNLVIEDLLNNNCLDKALNNG